MLVENSMALIRAKCKHTAMYYNNFRFDNGLHAAARIIFQSRKLHHFQSMLASAMIYTLYYNYIISV